MAIAPSASAFLTRSRIIGLSVVIISLLAAIVNANPPISKKGVCFGSDSSGDTAKCNDIRTFNVSWYYNWGQTPSCLAGVSGVEFVPMIWSAASLPLTGTLAPGSDWLLGFNEPNYANQANMSPQEAAQLWPQLEATGRRLVGPAMADCGDGLGGECTYSTLGWFRDFLGNCSGCRIDAVALHLYYCSDQDMMNKITALYELVQRPIWLTEFACNAPSSQSQPVSFAQALLPRLEASNIVQRYSWFLSYCSGCTAGGLLYDSLLNDETGSGNLTPIGSFYSGFASTDPAQASLSSPVFIDVGDLAPSVDSHGVVWLSDQGFNLASDSTLATYSDSSQTDSVQIDSYILATSRMADTNLTYQIPVSQAGSYNVTLYFSENVVSSAGQRLFNIAIQGSTVATNFDIFSSAGNQQGVLVAPSYTASVTSGSLIINISITSVSNSVVLSGLSVQPLDWSRPSSAQAMYVNIGGSGGTDASGHTWLPGANFTKNGNAASVTNTISGASSDLQFVYDTNQWGAFSIAIPAPSSGLYTVSILFAETYWSSSGQRVFNVSLQGIQVLSNYDIYTAAGASNTAVNATFTNVIVPSTLPYVLISTANVQDNALISGVIIQPSGVEYIGGVPSGGSPVTSPALVPNSNPSANVPSTIPNTAISPSNFELVFFLVIGLAMLVL